MSLKLDPYEARPEVLSLALGQLKRLDDAIEKEFTLVNDRVMWMVVSESFIFGAFATAAVAFDPAKRPRPWLVIALLIGLPIIGLVIAGFAHRAILAARDAAGRLKVQREPLETYFHISLRVQLPARGWPTDSQGDVPSRYLGPVFMISWFFFFVVLAAQLTLPTLVSWITAILVVLFLGGVVFVARLSFTRTIARLQKEVDMLESRLPPRGAPEADGGTTPAEPA